jgi:hypothetical protein
MGAYAAINRVKAVTATLYAPQYEHALMLLGSVLFRSFAGSLTYDSHVEGNAISSLSSRWIILRHSKTRQALFLAISTSHW